jgi:hypothetical protein
MVSFESIMSYLAILCIYGLRWYRAYYTIPEYAREN